MNKPEFEIEFSDIILWIMYWGFIGFVLDIGYSVVSDILGQDFASYSTDTMFSMHTIKVVCFSGFTGSLISLFVKRSKFNNQMLEYFEEIRLEEDRTSRQKIKDEELRKIQQIEAQEIRKRQQIEDEESRKRQQIENEELRRRQQIYNEELRISIAKINSQFDSNNNGVIELIDGESFKKLLHKNQQKIIDIDKNYIQNFVKISIYLNAKKENTQKIFVTIKDTKNISELNELVGLLKNQIHAFELLVFHSINMITSLVESDLITFYEIYECFDQLGVFNSNWQNEVSTKLTNIGVGISNIEERIRDLMYSIHQMEINIIESLGNLSYVTEESFKELNVSVNKQLSSIDSSIKFNTLLTVIQTYQMYKVNQNTKRIG